MRILCAVLCLLGVAVAVGASFAAVPGMISYQGKLTDAAGQPVSGSESITFTIYDVSSGGTALWSETHNSVSVNQGLFHVLLGSVTPLPDGAFQGDTWLGTSVNGTPLSPRVRMASVAYALRAKTADGVVDGVITTLQLADNSVTSAKIANGTITSNDLASDGGSLSKVSGGLMVSSNGGIGIGTTTPGGLLHVEGRTLQQDASQTSANLNIEGTSFWQSFTPAVSSLDFSARLMKVEAYLSMKDTGQVPPPYMYITATLRVYAGEGTSGQIIATDTINIWDYTPSWRTFEFMSPPVVTSWGPYTLAFSFNNPALGGVQTGNPYSGGSFSTDASYDLAFRTYVTDGPSQTALMVQTGSMNVGIGTTNPATTLDVAGTAKMTGFQLGTSSTAGYVMTAGTSGIGTWQALPGPSGSAGGDLAGSYPNPTIATGAVTSAKILDGTIATADIASGAVTGSKISTTGASSGMSLTYNGSTVAWGNPNASSLQLPFSGSINSSSSAFQVTNSGTGNAGDFIGKVVINGTLEMDTMGQNNGTSKPGIAFGWASGETIASKRTVGGNQFGLDFYTNNINRMTIANGGNVGIGTITPSYKLHVNGSVAGVGTYNQLSDARYKTNISAISDALDKVEKLRGVTFDWRRSEHPDIDFGEGRQVGVIAQEVAKVLPEAVSRDEEGTYSVAYSSLVPLLIQAVKEQQKTIEEQQRQIHDIMKLVGELRKER